MLANHLNEDALDGKFAPSLRSSTTPPDKKASVERANYAFHVAALGVRLGCRLGRSYHRPLITTECGPRLSIGPQYRKLYVPIQHQPVRFIAEMQCLPRGKTRIFK